MPSKTPDQPEDLVLAAIETERDTMESGDVDQYLAVLTDDAIFMPPNSPSKSGTELRSWLRGFLMDFRIEWLSYTSTETQIADQLAYHSYTYTWRVGARTAGEPSVSAGKGVHLLRREPDGSWRIAREIWNGNPVSPR